MAETQNFQLRISQSSNNYAIASRFDVNTLSNSLLNNIPKFSNIQSATIDFEALRGGISLSTSNADAYIIFNNEMVSSKSSVKGVIVKWWDNEVSTSKKNFNADLTPYIITSGASSGSINTSVLNSYSTHFFIGLASTLKRDLTMYDGVLKIIYDLPFISVSLSKQGNGTVSGAGIYNINKSGVAPTLEATADNGYKFVKWIDDNNNTVSTSSNWTLEKITDNNISAHQTNLHYTAIFEPIRIYVGTSQPDIYIGTYKVKGIYLGTTEIYG